MQSKIKFYYYVECFIIVFLVRLSILTLPFQYIIKITSKSDNKTHLDAKISWEIIANVVQIVKVFTNHLPQACLIRAVAVSIMLNRKGIQSKFHIGATINSVGRVCGHAWVTVADRVIIGGSESPIIYKEFEAVLGSRT